MTHVYPIIGQAIMTRMRVIFLGHDFGASAEPAKKAEVVST